MTLSGRRPRTEPRTGPAVRRLELPIPFPLRTANAYLVAGAAGTLLVDTGFYTREAWALPLRELAAVTARRGPLRAIVVTHHHPDHIGMAGRLQQRFGVPVVMSAGEAALLSRVWAPAGQQEELDFYRAHGTPAAVLAAIRTEYRDILAALLPLPDVTPVGPGALRLAGLTFRPIVTPGHSPAHLCLFHEGSRTLFVGDELLRVITPNIGWYPYTGPDPLSDFLGSFGAIERLAVRRALPGHRGVIRNVRARIAQLRAHHAHRLAAVGNILDGTTRTGYEVTMQLFGPLSPQQSRLGLVEALAHLEYLRRRGGVAAERRGHRVVYRREPGSPRYDPRHLETLENAWGTRRPHAVRHPETSPDLVAAIRTLRERYPRWGKVTLGVIQRREGWTVSDSIIGRTLTCLRATGHLAEPAVARAGVGRFGE